jgi:hypothetical protein
MTSNFFSPLSFVAVFGSGIRDKHPGSATLLFSIFVCVIFASLDPDPADQNQCGSIRRIRIHITAYLTCTDRDILIAAIVSNSLSRWCFRNADSDPAFIGYRAFGSLNFL